MNQHSMKEIGLPNVGYFSSKLQACAWPQEAISKMLEVCVAYSSLVI
jgi:hypothetical protein